MNLKLPDLAILGAAAFVAYMLFKQSKANAAAITPAAPTVKTGGTWADTSGINGFF